MKETPTPSVPLSLLLGLGSDQIATLASLQRDVERSAKAVEEALGAMRKAESQRAEFLAELGIVEPAIQKPEPAPLDWASPTPQPAGWPEVEMPAPSALERGAAAPAITELPAPPAPEGTWVELEQNPPAVVELVGDPSVKWVSTMEAARRLGVTRQKLANGILWNRFKWRKNGTVTEVLFSEVEKWIAEQAAPPAPKPATVLAPALYELKQEAIDRGKQFFPRFFVQQKGDEFRAVSLSSEGKEEGWIPVERWLRGGTGAWESQPLGGTVGSDGRGGSGPTHAIRGAALEARGVQDKRSENGGGARA